MSSGRIRITRYALARSILKPEALIVESLESDSGLPLDRLVVCRSDNERSDSIFLSWRSTTIWERLLRWWKS